MKPLTVITIENAIKEYEGVKGYKFNISTWDLASFIHKYIGEP